jgi:translation initiation factor 2A
MPNQSKFCKYTLYLFLLLLCACLSSVSFLKHPRPFLPLLTPWLISLSFSTHPPTHYRPSSDAGLTFSRDGSLVAAASAATITVYTADDFGVAHTFDESNCMALAFSPMASFIVSFHKWVKGQSKGNMVVRSLADGTEVVRFHQRDLRSANWPLLQWSDDEKVCIRCVKNTVQFMDGQNPSEIQDRLHLENVVSVKMAPGGAPYRVSTFVPSKNSMPAMVKVYEHPKLQTDQNISTKSFFNADTVDMNWNSTASMLLIRSSTEHDTSGRSYYGNSALHLLHADGKFSCTVPFDDIQAPVHDAQWNPNGRNFVTIQGRSPAQSTLFRGDTCDPIFKFGKGPYNTVRWSPHGRFLCLGGFGNLSGAMVFWDVNKKAKIGECQDPDGAKSFEWAPDSRSFTTAVLRPWRRVDNGYKVWSYAGEPLHSFKIEKLYQVEYRRAVDGVYPDRPISPRVQKMSKKIAAGTAPSSRPSAYVPPHLRNRAGGGAPSLADKLRAERTGDGPTKVSRKNKGPVVLPPSVPGAAPVVLEPEMSAAAKKNAKRREARRRKAEKKRQQQAKAESQAQQTDTGGKDKSNGKKKEDSKAAEPVPKKVDPAKRAKAIKKKLRQIDSLKQRQAGGESLDDAMIAKIESESSLRAELASLE